MIFSIASECSSSQGSNPARSRTNSGGRRPRHSPTAAFTPRAYASTSARVSEPMATRPAARASPSVRRKRSASKVSSPKSSLSRPWATRRKNSSCHRRSVACRYPCAKAASAREAAQTWGTPRESRRISTGRSRPGSTSSPDAGAGPVASRASQAAPARNASGTPISAANRNPRSRRPLLRARPPAPGRSRASGRRPPPDPPIPGRTRRECRPAPALRWSGPCAR